MQVNKSAGEWAPCVSHGPIYSFNSRVIKDDFNRVSTVLSDAAPKRRSNK